MKGAFLRAVIGKAGCNHLMAVPAFPRKSLPPSTGNLPPHPCTTISQHSHRSSNWIPRAFSAPTMYLMSSLSCMMDNGLQHITVHGALLAIRMHIKTCRSLTSRFLTSVVPSERAASRSTRFDRDLEPGS